MSAKAPDHQLSKGIGRLHLFGADLQTEQSPMTHLLALQDPGELVWSNSGTRRRNERKDTQIGDRFCRLNLLLGKRLFAPSQNVGRRLGSSLSARAGTLSMNPALLVSRLAARACNVCSEPKDKRRQAHQDSWHRKPPNCIRGHL